MFQVQAPGLRDGFPPLRTLDSTSGEPSASSRPACRTRSRARRYRPAVHDSSAGHTDRRRRGWQDPAGTGSRGATGGRIPGRCMAFRVRRGDDPAAVPDAVAAVLGITQQPGKSVTESVAAALEGRVRLLVFDNCEHVLDATADLAEAILAQSATSRFWRPAARVSGWQTNRSWPVPSLDSRLRPCELFAERAHHVAPGSDRRCGRGGRDLSPPRRNPVGDRAGRVADGVDDGGRGP